MEYRELNFKIDGNSYKVRWPESNTTHWTITKNGRNLDKEKLPTKRKVFFRDAVRRQEAKITRESFIKVRNAFYKHSPQGKAEHEKEQRMASAMQRLKRLLRK